MKHHVHILIVAVFIATIGNNGLTHASGANPIRKVVNMLKMMQKKIEAEGDQKSGLFDKFMCYCKQTGDSLAKAIAAAEEKLPQIESAIKGSAAGHAQLTEDLKQHKTDREEAKSAIETANQLRNKDAGSFAKESNDYKTNLASLSKAIVAIGKGTGAEGFLQTSAAAALKKLSATVNMADSDREVLESFLSTGANDQYSPQSGEILGILKQMSDDMAKDLAGIESDEESAVASHQSLTSAKEKMIKAASKAIEEKTGRVGELAVKLVQLRQDKDDCEDGLAEDKQFAASLAKSCEKKKEEWDVYQKNLSAEQLAIAETVKILNDDSALDLFKKTLPSSAAAGSAASFLQVADSKEESKEQAKHRAGKALKHARKGKRGGDLRVDLVQMALQGKKNAFDQVLAKVRQLVTLLAKEQVDDTAKQSYCNAELDKADDDKKARTRQISDLNAVIASTEDSFKAVEAEIADLARGVTELDKLVAEATANRKAEHSAFSESTAANNAAKDLLEVAKNRLAKFYNPALHKAPKEKTVSRNDQIAENFGVGDEAPAFVQLSQAPEADLSSDKQHEASGGVMAMLNNLKDDIEREIQGSKFEEAESQKDYEAFEKGAGEKRKLDSGVIAEKESARAELEASTHKEKSNLKGAQRELMETKKEIAGLHADCDWFLDNFDLRKEARANEVDALNKAEAVLHGANFS